MAYLRVGIFGLAFCFFVGVVLEVAQYHFIGPGLWHPTIVCGNRIHDLGEVPPDNPVPCEFVIKNAGRRPLTIKAVKPSCGGCVEVLESPKEAIPTNQSAVVRVSLLTRSLEGAVQKSIAVLSDDPVQPALTLIIKANVTKTSRGADSANIGQ